MLLSISGAVNMTLSAVAGVLMNYYGSDNSLVTDIVVALIGVSAFFYFNSWT